MALIALAFAFLSSAATFVNVSVPLSSSSAVTLSPSLVSFSIEQDRWPEWAGEATQNTFFYNALENLRQKTGEPPWIRIGADSEDHTNFNAATQVRTHVWWGVSLREDNLTSAYLETKAIVKAFTSAAVKNAGITLDFIEVGNEADMYVSNGGRVAPYGPKQYVPDWVTIATNVSAAAGLSSTSYTKLVGGSFAFSTHTTTGLSPQGIFAAGILTSKPGKLITTISQHLYSGSFCTGSGGLLQDLMTKATIRGNLTSLAPDIAATQKHGLDYVLGETNNYGCHGAPGVSNTAGAALWALDYSLYAPQIGISRLFFHEGIGYKYNFIQPVSLNRSIIDGSVLPTPLAPHVQPAYYAAIIAADAIGSSGATKSVELVINNAYLAGYAFYEGGTLARVLLINSKAYLTTTNTARGSLKVNLDFRGFGTTPKTMRIKRLTIGHADDTSGLTWGGQSYETGDALVSGHENVPATTVTSGITIFDTEVVLVQFLVTGGGRALKQRSFGLKRGSNSG
ncbi:hypothetical protein HWV62_34077 [Athelia sp. TMB]|nr:hypothetical protein HWV62_34077 [Athelia sp. TMB]